MCSPSFSDGEQRRHCIQVLYPKRQGLPLRDRWSAEIRAMTHQDLQRCGWCRKEAATRSSQLTRRPPQAQRLRVQNPLALDTCVFRKSVTGDFGIVADDFGNVTGDFGAVTDGHSGVS